MRVYDMIPRSSGIVNGPLAPRLQVVLHTAGGRCISSLQAVRCQLDSRGKCRRSFFRDSRTNYQQQQVSRGRNQQLFIR